MKDEVITREALSRVEERTALNLAQAEQSLRQEIKHEMEMRELTERLGTLALDKAEAFITEKTKEHNNLLGKMEMMQTTFVTKEDLEKEKTAMRSTVLFYISIASFLILAANYLIRNFVK